MFKKIFLAIVFSIASFSWANIAIAGGHCQGITMSDMKGVSAGAYPQVYELADFEKAANAELKTLDPKSKPIKVDRYKI